MYTSGSYPKLNGDSNNNSAAIASKPRLEDLLNNIIEAEKAEIKPVLSTQFGKASIGSSLSESDALLAALPQEIVSQLGINGLGRSAIFERIKSHYLENRHNPVLNSANHIVFIDYDKDLERVRLFIGLKSKFRCPQDVFEHAKAAFVVEHAVELTQTSSKKSFFGLKEKTATVALKLISGTEFLNSPERNCRESSEGKLDKLQPVLSFKFYSSRSHGVSSFCVKADVLPSF